MVPGFHFYSYQHNVHHVQHLKRDGQVQRASFADKILANVHKDKQFLKKILFSDESVFRVCCN